MTYKMREEQKETAHKLMHSPLLSERIDGLRLLLVAHYERYDESVGGNGLSGSEYVAQWLVANGDDTWLPADAVAYFRNVFPAKAVQKMNRGESY